MMTVEDAPVGWSDIRLTPLEDGDVDTVYRWHNSPDVRDLTMGFRFPAHREGVSDWLKRLREGNGAAKAVYAIRKAGALVGSVQLNEIDQLHRKALLGIFVADPRQRGLGVGHVAACLILDFAFNGLDLARIELEVMSSNTGAMRLYERLGFVREGTKRSDYFLDGKRHDVAVYGLLREEFRAEIPHDANRLVLSVS
jgi:UDP-4-amino-4,6-dideoxy-N-acetyl-beta-L-altrosamine N-acetyltransferase